MKGKKITTEEFIKRAKEVHGNKYDYSKTEYIDNKHTLCIICPIHGEFWQLPGSHLKGSGCKKCGIENMASKHKLTTDKFIEKAKLIFGISYDYSLVKYKNSSTKIKLKCNKCGNIFEITPNNHLKGQGCPHCAKEKKGAKKKTKKQFMEEARKIHNNKYDYSKSVYIGSHDKLSILCPIHGEFWQTPDNHLRGQGCPHCNASKLEEDISKVLRKNNILFERQYKFKNFGRQSLDFYIPKYKVAIECQGKQHVYPSYFGGDRFGNLDEQLSHIIELDKVKYEICKLHNIRLLYFISSEINKNDLYSVTIYNDKNTFWTSDALINEIKYGKEENR